MDPVAIILLLCVVALLVLFITRPFFERRRVRSKEGSPELSRLLAEQERLLVAVQELDFDQSLGKIPVEDYPAQRTDLIQKGAEILRQLDAISPDTGQTNGGSKVSDPTHLLMDPLSDEDLEDILSKRRSSHKEKTAGFCPKCGKPVLRSDDFCPSCGNKIK